MTERPSAPEVVPSTVRPGHGEVANVSGNHFDKHGSENGLIRRLMDRFHADLLSDVSSFAPAIVLDAGCGEGRTSAVIRSSGPRVVGLELEAEALSKSPRAIDGLDFLTGSVYEMPFLDDSFDVVTCTEVLEHLTDPAAAMSELVRVARTGVVVTVPREPWWRVANMARGAYLSRLGNTPGHVQHFTKRRLQALLSRSAGEARIEVSSSTMWRVGRLTL